MKSKPSDIPDSIKDIIGTFHSSDLVESSKEFLRGAINISMQNVYLGLVFLHYLLFFVFILSLKEVQKIKRSLIPADDCSLSSIHSFESNSYFKIIIF